MKVCLIFMTVSTVKKILMECKQKSAINNGAKSIMFTRYIKRRTILNSNLQPRKSYEQEHWEKNEKIFQQRKLKRKGYLKYISMLQCYVRNHVNCNSHCTNWTYLQILTFSIIYKIEKNQSLFKVKVIQRIKCL